MPIASPLFADATLLAKLPPMLIVVGDAEVMRDESVVFAARVEAAQAAVQAGGGGNGVEENAAVAATHAAANCRAEDVARISGVCTVQKKEMGVPRRRWWTRLQRLRPPRSSSKQHPRSHVGRRQLERSVMAMQEPALQGSRHRGRRKRGRSGSAGARRFGLPQMCAVRYSRIICYVR